MAQDAGIDLAQVTGTGPGGRIKKRDVLGHQAAPASAASPDISSGNVAAYGRTETTRVPLTGMRGAIADAMSKANAETAHTHIFGEIDITETLALRKRFVAKAEKLGTKVSMNAFFMKAMAVAAKQVPIANATLENGEIIIWDNVNIGMAVALEGQSQWDSGLLVPVVRDVQSKGLVEIDLEIRRLTEAARTGALGSDDTKGGTMTLSSTAGFWPGWATSTALINVPQVLIVQPASAVQKPVVVDGEIVVRDMMPISLTMDHRALDGVPYAKFYSIFHECLADPETLLA
jgi:pyruvate/2-oxoglutarate dehydrogenase complex dihydrolipoamide acyltransferase (E2) component